MALKGNRINSRDIARSRIGLREPFAAGHAASEFGQDRYVNVGQVRTRYRAAGKTGPGLIMLHGLGASL